MFGARSTYELVNPFVSNLRQRMHFGYVQDDWRASPKLTLNLGLRYEFATPQWEKDNFLTNFDPATNTLIQAKDGSIYDRALVNPDSNNFAPRARRRLQPDAEDGHPLGLRHQLHPLQPARRREPALVQRPARRADRDHAAAVAGAVRGEPGADDLLPDDAAGLSRGLNVPANFNPLNGRVNYIPPDTHTGNVQSWHVTVQRELLPNLLVDVAYVGNQQPQPHDPRRLQPGAAERRHRERCRCRRAGRFRASSSSRRRSTAARGTTTRCRSRSSGATRAGSTC